MGSKVTAQNNTSSTYSPPPNVLANYDAVTQQAQNVASNPYQSYNGNLVAGKTGEQRTGTAAVNSTAGVQNPYNTSATTDVNSSAAAINPTQFSGSQLTQYENPYQSQVVNATQAELNNADAQQASQLQGNAIASGAFGGDRAGIGQAALAGQQDIANNATIAGLNTANFQNAESEFNTQQGVNLGAAQNTAARQLAASQQLGSLGSTAQNEGLTEANAQVNAGTIGQQVAQAQDTANYNQFLQKQAYPFQSTGWLSNIIEGIGSQSGGTTSGVNTQTGSTAGSILGAGLGLASFLNRGGRVENDEIRLPRKALGGSLAPYDDMIGALGGGTYVPGINLPVGHTIPNPSSGTGAAGSSNTNGIGQIANGVKGLGNAFENSSLGDSFNDAIQDAGFYRGGLVRHYEDGGDAGGDGSAGDGPGGSSGDAGGMGNGVGAGMGAVGGDANGGVGAGASTGTVGADDGDGTAFGGLGSSQDPSSPAAFGLGYATTAQSMTNPGLAMGLAQTANTIGTQDGLGLSDPGALGFSPSKVTTRASNDDGTVGPAMGANDPGVNLGAAPSQAYSATGSMDPSQQAMANNLGMAPNIGQSEAPDAVAADASFANPTGLATAETSPAAIAALRASMSPNSVSQPNAPSAPAAPYGFSDSPAAIAALRAAMSPSTNQAVASSAPSVTGSVNFANPGDSSSSVSPSPVSSYSPSPSVSAPAVAAIQSYANPANSSNTPVGGQGATFGLGAAGRNDLGLTQVAANTLASSAPHPIAGIPTNVAPYAVTPVKMSDGSWATSHGGVLTPIATLASGGVARNRYDDGGIVDPNVLTDPGIGVSYTDPTLGTGVSGPLSFSQNIPGGDNQPTFSTSSPSSVSGQNDPGADNQPSFSPAVVSGLGAAIPRSDALPPQLAEAMTGFSPSAGTQAGNQIQVPSFPNAGMASSVGLGSPASSPADAASVYANQMPQARGAVNYGGPTVGDVPTDSQGYAIDPNTGARTQPSLGSAPIAPQPVVASNSRNPWMAPAYSGPTPKGPAPDPENYPTTQAGQAQFIRDYSAYAGGKGIDPNFALSVAKAEGLGAVSPKNPNGASSVDIDPQTGKPFSFGPFQLNVKNGLGRAALAAGIDPTDPAQGNAANKFAMDYMATHGIQPWRGDKAVMAYQGSGAVSPAGDAIATSAGPSQGLGAASVNPDTPAPGATEAQSNEAPNGGGGLLGMFGFHPTDAQRQAMLAAGLGMMAGTSRSGLVNIGQGGLAGLQQYNQARQLPVELGLKQAQTSEAEANAETAQLNNQKIKMQVERMWKHLQDNEAAGNDKADAIAAATAPKNVTDSTVTAPTVVPTTDQTVMMGARTSAVPANVSSNASAAPTPSPTTESSSVSGQVAPSPSTTNTPSQPSSAAISSGPRPVPDWDLANLTKQQNSALEDATYGLPGAKENVEAISARIAHIQAGGLVPMTDGTNAPYPQFQAAQAARAQAVAEAQENAKIPAATLGDWEKAQVAERTKAYGEAQNASALMNQATAMKNILFDPKTGKPTINSGPLGPHLGQMAALLQQIGAPPAVVKAFTGTDADAAQELNKISTSSASEIARSELAGSPVRVSEFQTYLKTLPSSEMLPGAMKYLIDNVIVPKAQQQMGAYEAVRGLHPERGDDVQGALYDYNKKNGWATVGQPAAPAITPPAGAVTMLKQNPSLAAQFDQKYGAGASRTVLGQ